MKVFSSIEKYSIPTYSPPHENPRIEGKPGVRDHLSDLEEDDELRTDKSTLVNGILTSKELTTLHMLFGSEKPDELTFYSNRGVPSGVTSYGIHQIQKGYLIDLIG